VLSSDKGEKGSSSKKKGGEKGRQINIFNFLFWMRKEKGREKSPLLATALSALGGESVRRREGGGTTFGNVLTFPSLAGRKEKKR